MVLLKFNNCRYRISSVFYNTNIDQTEEQVKISCNEKISMDLTVNSLNEEGEEGNLYLQQSQFVNNSLHKE